MKTKTIKETYVITYKKTILPKKIQKEILSKTIKILRPIFSNKHVDMILIGGSLSKMELGKYDKEYHGRFYSDIDVTVVADKKIKMPSGFVESYNLPPKILKVAKATNYRYIYKNKLDNKYPLHVHVFNTNVHNKKLALKWGMPIDGKKALIIYSKY